MAKRKPRRAKAAKAAAKKTTRAAKSRKSAARRVSAKRPSARKTTRKTTRKAAKKAKRQLVARKAAARRSTKRVAKKRVAKRRSVAKTAEMQAIGIAPVRPPAAAKAPRPKRAPTLDRARKSVGEAEPHGLPSSLDLDRGASAVRSGRKEMTERLKAHTSTGPAITAGDVDANWEDAESVGDEAPGGDNPTPDQDVVDDIGRALGVQYEDEEELKGGDEIASRDRHRWELDPASSDDFDDRD